MFCKAVVEASLVLVAEVLGEEVHFFAKGRYAFSERALETVASLLGGVEPRQTTLAAGRELRLFSPELVLEVLQGLPVLAVRDR